MAKHHAPINHVTDTAFWVATYRAEETQRKDALFHDPLAGRLAGELGEKISRKMYGSKYVRWTVVIRTAVIDTYIRELVAQGVDTVLNLGAGLDARPYRMDLPRHLRWVEVDYGTTIQMKQEQLANEVANCRLERISLDLSDRKERVELFSRLAAQSRKVLVLTEGVIPYLTEQDVVALAEDLRSQKNFDFWIAEYLAPHLYPYFKKKRRARQMKNAPFRFMPDDWYGTFEKSGWKPVSTRYLAEESEKLGRRVPMPWWASALRVFAGARNSKRMKRFSGFILFTRK